jgi:hypothetical protein
MLKAYKNKKKNLLVVIISGRPAQVTIPENMDAIHSMILDN